MTPTALKTRMAHAAILVACLLLLPQLAAARVGVTIKNIAPTPHHVEPGATRDEIATAIEAAANTVNWTMLKRTEEGELELSLTVRNRHVAIVKVGFDETDFWIDYHASTHLNYNPKPTVQWRNHKRFEIPGPRIHPNYNLWVAELAKTIATEAEFLVGVPKKWKELTDPAPPKSAPLGVADRIEALSRRLSEGEISQEEFDEGTARLLDA